MTSITTTTAPATRRTLTGLLGRSQAALSTRVHAAGDAAMARKGLTVEASTGRSGFGARAYRHPGFDRR